MPVWHVNVENLTTTRRSTIPIPCQPRSQEPDHVPEEENPAVVMVDLGSVAAQPKRERRKKNDSVSFRTRIPFQSSHHEFK